MLPCVCSGGCTEQIGVYFFFFSLTRILTLRYLSHSGCCWHDHYQAATYFLLLAGMHQRLAFLGAEPYYVWWGNVFPTVRARYAPRETAKQLSQKVA